MRDQRDITSTVLPLIAGMSSLESEGIIDSIADAMTDSVKAIDRTLHVDIDPFLEGNKYYATTYQDFTDLRLVFCVPKSMGKYGCETHNWMWPRQNCEFSVFRIYSGKDNRPAPYSKDNVPYHPSSWAQVSLDGYELSSFSMTVGYPGSTERYLSSYGIESMKATDNDTCIQVRKIKLDILKKFMDSSESDHINYENAYANSANYYKNSIGMNRCIDSIGLIAQKQAFEARIAQWQESRPADSRVDFATLARLYKEINPVKRAEQYWGESFYRNSEFFRRAMAVSNPAHVVNPDAPLKDRYVEIDDNSSKWNINLDKELTEAMLRNYAEQVPEEYLPSFYTTIKNEYKGDYHKYVDYLYNTSELLKPSAKFYPARKNYLKDPGVNFGTELVSTITLIQMKEWPIADSISAEERKLCAAKVRMEQDLPHYSDANFTMRLSYGQVGGYRIGSRETSYYTNAPSIIKKMALGNENAEYKAEPIMHELLSKKDYGRYQDPRTGTLQLCFLTNNDITGGNSGSPMFDGKGRLIGVAFDGNCDSLASDINFDRVLARCIGVDIRYVLYMMDKWGHADRLLKEINPQSSSK